MRVFLDADCVDQQADGLSEALRAAADRAQSLGRIVIEVHADGEPIPTEALDDPDAYADTIAELRLTSARPATFLKMTLHEAADALDRAELDQTSGADLIEQGDVKGGFEHVGEAFILWDAARDVVEKTSQLLSIDLDAIHLSDEHPGVTDAVKSLRTHLESVKGAMAAEDWAQLSDLLRYDLAEEANRWRGMLRALAEQVGAMDASGD